MQSDLIRQNADTTPVTGIVHLRDLARHYAWEKPQLPRYLEWLDITPGSEQIHSVVPPQQLVVICHCNELHMLENFRLWMSLSPSLYVYISFEECPELWHNMDKRRQLTTEAGKHVRSLNLAGLRNFGQQFTESQTLELKDILFGMNARPARNAFVPAFPAHPTPFPETTPFQSGPWCCITKHPCLEANQIWPRLICLNQGRPSLLMPTERQFLCLDDGILGPKLDVNCHGTPFPDGSQILTSLTGQGLKILSLQNGHAPQDRPPLGDVIGLWPTDPVQIGWRGGRCVFDWLIISSGQAGCLSACEHNWPCGHEKKQYGFLDNEPCWIQLSRDADCYLSVYQKDAIINDRVPIRWTKCAGTWGARCELDSHPNRALFFCHDETDDWEGNPLDPDDSDARMTRPAIVLGPNPIYRYALDLSRPVYRIQGDTSQLVSGAAVRAPKSSKTGHFGVFSAEHQLRRLGSGRLLGGWDRWLTTLKNGRLQREEIDSGKIVDLGPEDREISWAFSLPGTPNIVLVHEHEDAVEVRLV
jgi:hypothetical protein